MDNLISGGLKKHNPTNEIGFLSCAIFRSGSKNNNLYYMQNNITEESLKNGFKLILKTEL